jgi:hypothetical protein
MEKINEKVYCERCKRKTNHGVLHKQTNGYAGPEDLRWEENHYISFCLGCDTVNFVRIYSDESMVVYDPYEEEYNHIEDISVYPSEPINVKNGFIGWNEHQEKQFHNLPELIQMLYIEVIKAYNANLYLLSAIGLRMVVEGICKDLTIIDGPVIDDITGSNKIDENGKEIRSKKLVGQINGLIERGVIVQAQSRILHEIRVLGNQTAHELTKPKVRTIYAGIEIIESILHIIYELDKYSIIKK